LVALSETESAKETHLDLLTILTLMLEAEVFEFKFYLLLNFDRLKAVLVQISNINADVTRSFVILGFVKSLLFSFEGEFTRKLQI